MERESDDLIRVNVRVSPEVHQFYKDRSAKTGVSMSSLMFLTLEKSMQEQRFIGGDLRDLLEFSQRMEQMGLLKDQASLHQFKAIMAAFDQGEN